MSGVLILNNNFNDVDFVNSYSSSSAKSAYPLLNANNFQRRSKVFRTDGYWDITSSNNGIIFRETVGVNLTASIVVASYASTTSLCTAIKTAMELVGDATYTVSQDATTGKIKIVSDGLGGGGIFQLMLTNVGFTSAATLGFSTSADKTGALTYKADVLKIHTSEYVLWDFGISALPKAIVLAGPRNQPLKLSPSATIQIQGNETNIWTSPSYSTSLTYSSTGIYKIDADGLGTTPYRYWRLYIEDKSNTYLYVEIGLLYLGDAFDSTRGAVQFPLNSQYSDTSNVVVSDSGHVIAIDKERGQQFNLNWQGLTYTDMETIEEMFIRLGKVTPFFVSIDPNASFSSDAGKYLRLVRFSDEPKFTLVSPNNFSMEMQLREEL